MRAPMTSLRIFLLYCVVSGCGTTKRRYPNGGVHRRLGEPYIRPVLGPPKFNPAVRRTMRAPPEADITAPEFPPRLDWVGAAFLRMDKQLGRPVLLEFIDTARVNSL